jgi:PadR family transcriptional regulator PadR
MTTSKADLLQGTLDMLVLKVVGRGPLHGYAIAREIRRISNDVLQVQQGSLYPALHKLEKKQWLKSEWRATDTGREAKYYSLTAKGRQQLEAERDNWNRLAEAIGLILREAD